MIGRAVVITGGASGIGLAAAKRLGANGAALCISDIQESAVDDKVRQLRALGYKAIGVKTDVCEEDQVEELMEKCKDAFGSVDYLVACAGIYSIIPFEKMTFQEWKNTIHVNLHGVFLSIKKALPHMLANQFGRIVSLTSQAGIQGSPGCAHYAASKAGILGLTRSVAKEVATRNVRINCIAPGIIETPMVEASRQEREQIWMEKIPMDRFGKAEEVASVISFLLSEEASYMTGQTLNVTGGWLVNT